MVSSHCIYTLCTPRLFYVSLYSLGNGGNFVFTVASGPSKSPSQLGNSRLNAISEGVQKETNKHARANAYGSRHLYVTVSSRFKCLFCLTRDAKPNKKSDINRELIPSRLVPLLLPRYYFSSFFFSLVRSPRSAPSSLCSYRIIRCENDYEATSGCKVNRIYCPPLWLRNILFFLFFFFCYIFYSRQQMRLFFLRCVRCVFDEYFCWGMNPGRITPLSRFSADCIEKISIKISFRYRKINGALNTFSRSAWYSGEQRDIFITPYSLSTFSLLPDVSAHGATEYEHVILNLLCLAWAENAWELICCAQT